MKNKYCIIILCLIVCLYIYLFYRTDKTVINGIFISIISFDKYVALQKTVTNAIPLNEHIIYSLPEGLWVFCITITSKDFFVKVGNWIINLFTFPFIFSIGLEVFQFFNFTNGRFDFWDIGFSFLFWLLGIYLIKQKGIRQNILIPFTINSFICILSYLIVYLAHVWK